MVNVVRQKLLCRIQIEHERHVSGPMPLCNACKVDWIFVVC
jgi:hypothetical protein